MNIIDSWFLPLFNVTAAQEIPLKAGGSIPFWHPTALTDNILIYLAILAAVVTPVAFFISRSTKKKVSEEESLVVEVDPDEFIASILERAMELQVKFDLVCTRSTLTQRHLQCYGVPDILPLQDKDGAQNENSKKKAHANPYLTLRVAEGFLPKGWDQAPIDVYLQLVQNGQGTLYHFASFVCRITQADGHLLMTINRPSILGDSQSREAVRIEPSPDTIALASAWIYGKDSHMLPAQVKELGKAFGVFRPEGNSDFRVVNISACGIRLRFVAEDIEKLPFPVEKYMELCLFLAVNTKQEKSKRMLLWLKCECKGPAPCAEKDCVDVRFSFTHWQQIYERSEQIDWHEATDSDRVPPLMHWIMSSGEEIMREGDASSRE